MTAVPMLRLTYSNATEELLDELARELDGRDPLEPAHLVVPNRNVETFVKLRLAQARGIAANLKVHFLRRFVSEALERARPGVRVVDGDVLLGLLLRLLCDDDLVGDAELGPVRDYLYAEGRDGDVVDRRRYQLATRLARIFDEYGVSRPELLEAWRAGRPSEIAAHPALQGTEAWQRRLWRALFARGGLARDGTLLLSDAFRDVDPRTLGLPDRVHVFGISYMGRVFHQILDALGRATDLHVYTLNPCREFWEDATVDLESDDPFGLESGDAPALRLWGRPGRENIRLLNELTDCNFSERYVSRGATALPSHGATLLTALQRDVLQRAAPAELPGDPDDSLRVLACPGVRRELEVIAAEIWRCVRADPSLRFDEIAVILPAAQKEAYQTHLQAVFREMHDLPHAIADLPLSAESRIVEALQLLVDLPLGPFGRQELLRLLTHPHVMARLEGATAADWLGWCVALGIVHGADHKDHDGTYIAHDILNWDQGLRRLALGAFMSGRASGEARAFAHSGEDYLPEEQAQGQLRSAATFALLARSLMADARFAGTARRTLPEWVAFLRSFVAAHITPAHDDDERVLGKCLSVLADLSSLDLGGQKVSYRIPYELFSAALAGLSGHPSQYLEGGVVVASFLPMRAIPFRVVFVAGLGEGEFPSGDARDPLDLRQARRRPGDVAAREQDRYMFLETLLCARERLVLSYVARDPLTGDERAPSTVITELDGIARAYRPSSWKHERFPLRRHEDARTVQASPEARAEDAARRLGRHLHEHAGIKPPRAAELHRALPKGLREEVAAQLRFGAPGDALPQEDGGRVVRLPASALRQVLECPLQGSARYLLGLREQDDEDVTALRDEPFETPRLLSIELLRGVFRAALEPGAPPLETLYDARARLHALAGEMPSGPFAAAERSGDLRTLAAWMEVLALQPSRSPIQVFRFGRAEEHARVDEIEDPVILPITVNGHAVRVELHGRTELVLTDAPGSLVLVKRGSDSGDRWQRDALRGALDHAMLAAAGLTAARDYTTWVAQATARGAKPRTVRMASLSADEARAWLTTLASDLLSGVHDYLLPCEAVFKGGQRPYAEVIDGLRDGASWGQGLSFQYGPVRNAERYEPPPEAEARAMVERRFGPYRSRVKESG